MDHFGAVRTLRVQLLVLAAMMLLVPLTRGSLPLMVLVFATRKPAMVPWRLAPRFAMPH